MRQGVRKGVTPLVAAVVLMGIVVASAGAVMLWAQGAKEKVEAGLVGAAEEQAEARSFEATLVFVEKSSLGKMELTFKNTGDSVLDTGTISVFVDGQPETMSCSPPSVEPGGLAECILTEDFPSGGSKYIKIVPYAGRTFTYTCRYAAGESYC